MPSNSPNIANPLIDTSDTLVLNVSNTLTPKVEFHAVHPIINNTNNIEKITIIGATEYLLEIFSPANISLDLISSLSIFLLFFSL